ncbi:MAG: RNA polymerase sigma factor, partial [Opitutales bacterium]
MPSPTDSERLVEAVLPLYDELKGFFIRRLRCRHDADDLAQQTMERVLGWAGPGAVASPRGFVFRVARNLL